MDSGCGWLLIRAERIVDETGKGAGERKKTLTKKYTFLSGWRSGRTMVRISPESGLVKGILAKKCQFFWQRKCYKIPEMATLVPDKKV